MSILLYIFFILTCKCFVCENVSKVKCCDIVYQNSMFTMLLGHFYVKGVLFCAEKNV